MSPQSFTFQLINQKCCCREYSQSAESRCDDLDGYDETEPVMLSWWLKTKSSAECHGMSGPAWRRKGASMRPGASNYQRCLLNQCETNALQMHKFCGFVGILHPRCSCETAFRHQTLCQPIYQGILNWNPWTSRPTIIRKKICKNLTRENLSKR